VQVGGWRRLDLVRIPVTHTNVGCLQVLSGAQVTPELSMSMRIRPI
jgi:hypothetical protein